jgi:hypothetical protein
LAFQELRLVSPLSARLIFQKRFHGNRFLGAFNRYRLRHCKFVNLTDGIDGLCSSVTATAAIAFIVISYIQGFAGLGILSAALLGAFAASFAGTGIPPKPLWAIRVPLSRRNDCFAWICNQMPAASSSDRIIYVCEI